MVSVADLLAEPELRLRAVELPDPGATVRWVATSELADPTPFLEGGEVLLTTGLDGAGRSAAEWDDYARRLVAAGAVAVGFGVGLSHDVVPSELTRACRRQALNLVEVPRPTRFVSISRVIARKVGEPGQAAAREALVMQRELTMAALRDDGVSPVVARLADILAGGACMVSADGGPVVSRQGVAAPALEPDRLRPIVRRLRPGGLRASHTESGPGGVAVVQPVGLRGRPHRYLAVWAPALTDGRREAVTTAVALLGLADERGAVLRDVDGRLRRLAIELVVGHDPRAAAGVLAATGTTSARLPDPLRVVRATGPADALHDALWWLDEASRLGVLAARLDDELWVLADPPDADGWARGLGERGLAVGVGLETELTDARRSAGTAARALERAATGSVVHWGDVVSGGAAGLIEAGAGAAFAGAFLDRVAVAPSGRAVLLPTLESFVRHHGQRGAVAADLGIHRNTVRNRIREIETALGRSLDDPAVRVDSWLALRFAGDDDPDR